MKKILPYFSIALIASVILFFVAFAIKFFQPESNVEKQKKLAYETYRKLHNKEMGKPFLVDSIAYQVSKFTYIPRKDSMILIVDLNINNVTNHSKRYTNKFFKLIGGDENKTYYPSQKSFTVFENRSQNLELTYRLERNSIPTMWCDLYIDSETDSIQNSYITFAQNFREGG